jgi:three-Cys-motif partner protein
MQVEWKTIEAIAQTKAIDLWILFPLMAVNRVLKKNGDLDPIMKAKLDGIFGESDWYDEFYPKKTQLGLFGDETRVEKVSFEEIGQYFVRRLKTAFKHVAENPLLLLNSLNNPLFLLCFAAENQTAVKIAQFILK